MLNGVASTMPAWVTDLDWSAFPTPETAQVARDHGVRYILIHYPLMSEAERLAFADRWDAYQQTYGEFPYVGTFGGVDVIALPGDDSLPNP
jgi:hypothetical protein